MTVIDQAPPAPPRAPRRALRGALARAIASDGESLLSWSERSPLLVVFLRHHGCTFCREALSDIGARRREIEATGLTIVAVHMGTVEQGLALLKREQLQDVLQVSDPEQSLYQLFGLRRGRLAQLFNWFVVLRTLSATVRGHLAGRAIGDTSQMPGAFVVHRGEVVRAFRHKTAADRLDYVALAEGSDVD